MSKKNNKKMLPGITIEFDNGVLGAISPGADGVFGLLAGTADVNVDGVRTFELGKAYTIRSMKDVAKLGIMPGSIDHSRLYKTLDEFYQEAGEGTELWLMGFPRTGTVSSWFTVDPAIGKTPVEVLLDAAQGKIRGLFTSYYPAQGQGEAKTKGQKKQIRSLESGLDSDVWLAMAKAQTLAENYTESRYAPFMTILEGYGFDGNITALRDLNTLNYNRVGILIGDTEPKTHPDYINEGAAVGVIAGRLAKNQVHVNIARVRDGAVRATKVFVLDSPVEQFDTASLYQKGYLSFRTYQGKAGYYLIDDPLATAVSDDYHYITRRRVIDKAYRICYGVLLNYLLDQVPVSSQGKISVPYLKAIEADVENNIAASMTAYGELSADPDDKNDKGVICSIDPDQNIITNSRLQVSVKIRPHGYARYIDVLLGFTIGEDK